MLDAAPRESEQISWLYVGLATLIIFATAPIARAIQSVVAEHAGPNFYLYVSTAVTVAGGLFAVRFLRRRRVHPAGYLWLGLAGIGYALMAYSLRRIPVEVLHLVQYGVLSLLVYRALLHRLRDPSIYLIAVAVTGIIGILDEWVQWMVPSRFWGLSDVLTNVTGASLMQVAIGAGLRPGLVSGRPSARGLDRLCLLLAIGTTMLGLSYANTPERIAVYASRIPFLSFLLDSKSMMVEYGYRYEDPDIGIFRSRFTLEELAANDRARGLDLARVLDEYINDERYGQFLEVYSVPRDAYIHEAGVHLFRRNRWLKAAQTEEPRRFFHYNVALRENQILEKYFPTGIRHSTHFWRDELRDEVDILADKGKVYESRVSMDVVTEVTQRQVLTGFAAATLALLLLAGYFRRRAGDFEATAPASTGEDA